MFKKILAVAILMLFGAQIVFASGMSSTDKDLMTKYSPWTFQFENGSGFGNVIYGYIGITGSGIVSATNQGTIPVTLQTLKFSVNGAGFGGGNIGMTLPNGVEGQSINLNSSVATNSGILIITPTTKVGFSNIILAAAGQGCIVTYQDSTNGWRLDGCYAASASTYPVVTQ